jgi:squid-like protein/heterogeneous nuclear ribonucleoprotein A1/A3
MNASPVRGLACVLLLAGVAVLSGGCVAEGGYGYAGGVGVGMDYYEPVGAIYGGWGPGYLVGPGRGGPYRGGGGGVAHSYRSSPAGHSAPSIPSGGRSGGGGRR